MRSPLMFGRSLASTCAAVIASLYGAAANAHTGHEIGGLLAGMAHPFSGLDHLLAMVAVGLWARQLGARGALSVPLAFLGLMLVGGMLVFGGWRLPAAESWVLASVATLGLLIASAVRLPTALCAAIAGLFAIFHGHAHATEVPAAAAPLLYSTGFMMSTALLQLGGIGAAKLLSEQVSPHSVRWAGASIAMAGAALAFA